MKTETPLYPPGTPKIRSRQTVSAKARGFVSRFIICVMLLCALTLGVNSAGTESTGEIIAGYALEFENCRYSYGGTSPSGFDCSGFVWYVYRNFGYSVGRTCSAQYKSGIRVTKNNLLPGDIVLFGNTYGNGLSHSGIYIGSGKFIHAEGYKSGVTISCLSESYYENRFATGIRVVFTVKKNIKESTEIKCLLIVERVVQ